MKKYNSNVFKSAIKYLTLNDPRKMESLKSPYACDAIRYACDELNEPRPEDYIKLFETFFEDRKSEYYKYFGWFDKSSPKQALKERKIALDLMYHISKEL